jgi:hypothetical protein
MGYYAFKARVSSGGVTEGDEPPVHLYVARPTRQRSDPGQVNVGKLGLQPLEDRRFVIDSTGSSDSHLESLPQYGDNQEQE